MVGVVELISVSWRGMEGKEIMWRVAERWCSALCGGGREGGRV